MSLGIAVNRFLIPTIIFLRKIRSIFFCHMIFPFQKIELCRCYSLLNTCLFLFWSRASPHATQRADTLPSHCVTPQKANCDGNSSTDTWPVVHLKASSKAVIPGPLRGGCSRSGGNHSGRGGPLKMEILRREDYSRYSVTKEDVIKIHPFGCSLSWAAEDWWAPGAWLRAAVFSGRFVECPQAQNGARTESELTL